MPLIDGYKTVINGLMLTLEELHQLNTRLLACATADQKLQLLDSLPPVVDYLKTNRWLEDALAEASMEQRLVLNQLIAIGQGPSLLRPLDDAQRTREALHQLLASLIPIDRFYQNLGGLVGYHLTVCRLMQGESLSPYERAGHLRYSIPKAIDLRQDSQMLRQAIVEGVSQLPATAQFFALGGAGDRLQFFHPTTGEALPVACLSLGGFGCLLDILMRDVQSLEHLHYRLFGRQVLTPIAMMTSEEKNNHQQLLALCEQRRWFNRPRESFFLFAQPRAPVITETGIWADNGPFCPIFKPGGHGVIWRLAQDHGVFDWLETRGCRKALVRQINNPVAGTDHGLLAFLGIGWRHNKAFGFASCDRRLNAPEGMNVLIETQSDGCYEYRITNVEYTEFEKHGLKDQPIQPGSPYSAFPCNTNILFLDLKVVQQALTKMFIPGMLVNCKSRFPMTDVHGDRHELPGGRLEGTMQNIADVLVDSWKQPWDGSDPLAFSTYMTFNERHKTLATVKNASKRPGAAPDTAESAFYGLLRNHWELLKEHCGIDLPVLPALEQCMEQGPPVLIQLHPGLGPLYSIIAQKIGKGKVSPGSHLVLEIADLVLVDLHLQGSLQIRCECPLGHLDASGQHVYSNQTGKCVLRQVTVRNRGMEALQTQRYWKEPVRLLESLEIYLQGHGEFHAENVTFEGPTQITIGPDERVVATQGVDGKVVLTRTKLANPSWQWHYSIDSTLSIRLDMRDHTVTSRAGS